jgi:glycosyltransferase involved in cell wall biosynthesis
MATRGSLPTVVDVGIPAIGGSRLPYLVEAIESVLAQTFSDWRLLISEDGPGTEEFRRTLQTYTEDPRVTHRVVGTRIGIGKNFTTLVRSGDARYVAILNDDDRWEPEYLARRVAFLDEHPSCGLVFSGATIIDEDGAVVGRTKLGLSPGRHSSADVLPALFGANFMPAPSVLVRRAAYDRVGATYSDRIFSDHEMWLHVATYFDVGCLAAWDAHYRMHASQTVSSKRLELGRHRLELLDAVEDVPVSGAVRRESYAVAHVACALDAVEAGERRRALGHLREALRTRSRALVRPRTAARVGLVLGASALGAAGRRALTRARERRWATSGAVPLGELSRG